MNDTRYHPARLVFSNRDVFAYYTNTFLYYAGDTRMPPRVPTSGSEPCGGKNLHFLALSEHRLRQFSPQPLQLCRSRSKVKHGNRKMCAFLGVFLAQGLGTENTVNTHVAERKKAPNVPPA